MSKTKATSLPREDAAVPATPSGVYVITCITEAPMNWEDLLIQEPWLKNRVLLMQSKQPKQGKKGYAAFHVVPTFRKDSHRICAYMFALGFEPSLVRIEVDLD